MGETRRNTFGLEWSRVEFIIISVVAFSFLASCRLVVPLGSGVAICNAVASLSGT